MKIHSPGNFLLVSTAQIKRPGKSPVATSDLFVKSTTQKSTKSTGEILSVQLKNSISPLIFNEFLQF